MLSVSAEAFSNVVKGRWRRAGGDRFNWYSWEWSLGCGTSLGENVKTEVIYIEMRVMKTAMTTETYTTITQNNLSGTLCCAIFLTLEEVTGKRDLEQICGTDMSERI